MSTVETTSSAVTWDDKEARDAVRFCIEQSHAEVGFFWTRANLLLAINTASVAAAIAWLTSDPRPKNPYLIWLIGLAGIAFSLVWLLITRISQYYQDRWLREARRFATMHPKLIDEFYLSLGFREHPETYPYTSKQKTTPSKWQDNPFLDIHRPKLPATIERPWGYLRSFVRYSGSPTSFPSSTACMYSIGWIFVICWIGILGQSFVGTSSEDVAALAQTADARPLSNSHLSLTGLDVTVICGVVGVLQLIFGTWLKSSIDNSVRHTYDKKLEELRYDVRRREQAARVAKLFAMTTGGPIQPREFHELVWELSLWLPPAIVKEISRCLCEVPEALKPKEILIEIRKLLNDGIDDGLRPEHIVHGVVSGTWLGPQADRDASNN